MHTIATRRMCVASWNPAREQTTTVDVSVSVLRICAPSCAPGLRVVWNSVWLKAVLISCMRKSPSYHQLHMSHGEVSRWHRPANRLLRRLGTTKVQPRDVEHSDFVTEQLQKHATRIRCTRWKNDTSWKPETIDWRLNARVGFYRVHVLNDNWEEMRLILTAHWRRGAWKWEENRATTNIVVGSDRSRNPADKSRSGAPNGRTRRPKYSRSGVGTRSTRATTRPAVSRIFGIWHFRSPQNER